jgi:hypothetical protein
LLQGNKLNNPTEKSINHPKYLRGLAWPSHVLPHRWLGSYNKGLACMEPASRQPNHLARPAQAPTGSSLFNGNMRLNLERPFFVMADTFLVLLLCTFSDPRPS